MSKKRYILFLTSVFAVLLLLLTRFFYISVIKNSSYLTLAFSQQTATREIKKIRSDICDRNLIPFTETEKVTRYIGKNGDINSEKSQFFFQSTLRYSSKNTACHIIGHTDADSNGISGIEKEFDSFLNTDNYTTVSYFSDALGSPVGEVQRSFSPAQKGSVVLTLDSHIQKIAEEVMDKYIQRGAAVIIDTHTFDILASVSRPGYNPEKIESYMNSENGEFLNRALMPYNAGSVFKIVTASAALEKNYFYHNRLFYCGGEFTPDGKAYFKCHSGDGHGVSDMFHSFADSCNTAFYETGLCTGGNEICKTALSFGLGKKVLNLDMNESAGNIPEKEEFSAYETINLSIGQGEILITPLQCTQIAAIIANGGTLKQVNLVKSLIYPDASVDTSVYEKSEKQVIKPSTAALIGYMMREAVASGTAYEAYDCSVEIAGKTGSAETGWKNEDGSLKVHGWFCGFFPYDNPRYAMTIFSEDGKSGAGSCVRPFVEIAEKIYEIYPY